MKREYLGDSYDIVKRFWHDLLTNWARLYAEPRFLPVDLVDDFEQLTRIGCLPKEPPSPYSILNDPDTGIRLPGMPNQREGRSHITIATIVEQVRRPGVRCVVTFDQSHYRSITFGRRLQRRAKLRELRRRHVPSFYYVSHASFLFSFPDLDCFVEVRERLLRAGVPENRVECICA